jgi:hypothetical protein
MDLLSEWMGEDLEIFPVPVFDSKGKWWGGDWCFENGEQGEEGGVAVVVEKKGLSLYEGCGKRGVVLGAM